MKRNFSWDMPNHFRDIKTFAFNTYYKSIRTNFCLNLYLFQSPLVLHHLFSILVDSISVGCNLCLKQKRCCLSHFCISNGWAKKKSNLVSGNRQSEIFFTTYFFTIFSLGNLIVRIDVFSFRTTKSRILCFSIKKSAARIFI